jgi:hypothetical protein
MTAPTIYTQATSRPTSARGALQKDPEKPVPINYVIGNRALQGPPASHKEGHRSSARLCYSYRKPKGPVCEDTISVEVAAPTVKRGIVMSEFDRRAPARAGMVLGRWAIPRGWPHGYGRVFNICPPDMREGVSGGFQSLVGAETMTKVIPLARTAAPIISIASRRAAPIQSPADTTDPQIIGLHIAAENALASALHLLRSIDCDPAKLQAATGRAIRAATMLKRLSAAQAEGGAA